MKKRKVTTKVVSGRKVVTNPVFKDDYTTASKERDRTMALVDQRLEELRHSLKLLVLMNCSACLAIGRALATKSNFKRKAKAHGKKM